jgi:hypothetical protein
MLRGYSLGTAPRGLVTALTAATAVRHRRYILILLTYTGRVLWNLELAKAINAPTLDRCGTARSQPVGLVWHSLSDSSDKRRATRGALFVQRRVIHRDGFGLGPQ